VFGLGGTEMGVIFLIILLVFGPSQIPKMARAMGEAMREFRKAQREVNDEINRAADTDDKKQPTSKPME
jgi:sec-independent protein translocase protein TatA